MPIELPRPLRNLTSSEFDEVDRLLMPLAYAAQNALGCLWDEPVYENKLAELLRSAGVAEVHTQMPVFVRHDGFEKQYRLDLVVSDAIYELKVVQEFAPYHDTQAFHYAMLANVNHIKLLNFRPARVQGLLRYNAVLGAERHQPQWHDLAWRAVAPQCRELRERFTALVADWGTHLDYRLYEETLIFFCGGEVTCKLRVPVRHEGCQLGSHCLLTHAEGLAFLVTCFADPRPHQRHIRRVRELTERRAIQWMNLHRRDIYLVTIE